MNLNNSFVKEKYSVDRIYYGLIFDISYYLYELMEQKGITKKELAKKMNVTPAYITKILSADCNISLKTIAKVLSALEVDGGIKLIDRDKINLNKIGNNTKPDNNFLLSFFENINVKNNEEKDESYSFSYAA